MLLRHGTLPARVLQWQHRCTDPCELALDPWQGGSASAALLGHRPSLYEPSRLPQQRYQMGQLPSNILIIAAAARRVRARAVKAGIKPAATAAGATSLSLCRFRPRS